MIVRQFAARPSKKFPRGDHQFSDRHFLTALKLVLRKLGMPGHVHTFRHALISDALTRGTPEAIVRQWVGHVDAEIIRLYTHIADASSQAAMQRLTKKTNRGSKKEGAGVEKHGQDSAQIQHNEENQKSGRNASQGRLGGCGGFFPFQRRGRDSKLASMGWTYVAPTSHLRRKSLRSRTFRDIQASSALYSR